MKVIGLSSCLAVSLVAFACGVVAPSRAAADENNELKNGPGRDLTTGLCAICHSLDYIPSNAPAMNRAAWQKTLQKMRERFGAPLSDAQTQTLLDYLDANYSGKAQ